MDEFFIDQNDIGLVEENEEIENDLEDNLEDDLEDDLEDGNEDEEAENDPLNSSTDSTKTSLTTIMKPDGAIKYEHHDSSQKGSSSSRIRVPPTFCLDQVQFRWLKCGVSEIGKTTSNPLMLHHLN